MKSKLKNKDGISLISMIIIGVIIVVVVYILILLLKDGIKVLSKAQTARKQTKSNQIIEQVDLILVNYNAVIAMQQKRNIPFEDYLKTSKENGDIENYWYSENLVIVKYKNNYVILLKNKDSYSNKGLVYIENDEYANLAVKNYEKSIDPQSKEKIKIEDKNTYIISGSVRADCYDYNIENNQNVTIAIVEKVEINNKNIDKPAIKIGYNSSLKLYIYEETTISSLYNGLEEIKYDQVRESGGYAGINLPETSTLNIYGNKTLRVYGGPAGKGGTYTEQDITLGSGGGGAGAGIGGNGGSGGKADEKKSNQGGNGENCGDVKLTESVELYVYGGAGASGGDSTTEGAGAGGGYPAAGIGGGRSWRPEVLQN